MSRRTLISSLKRWVTYTWRKATLSAADLRVCKGQKQARECLASGTRANDIRVLKESQSFYAGSFYAGFCAGKFICFLCLILWNWCSLNNCFQSATQLQPGDHLTKSAGGY